MATIPQPRQSPEGGPSKDQCWDEFWEIITDAIAEAKIREARERA